MPTESTLAHMVKAFGQTREALLAGASRGFRQEISIGRFHAVSPG